MKWQLLRETLKIAEFLDNGIKEKLLKENKILLKKISEKANIKSVKNDKSMVSLFLPKRKLNKKEKL